MSDSSLEAAALRLLYSFSFLVLCSMIFELFIGLLPLREVPFRQVLVGGDLSHQLDLNVQQGLIRTPGLDTARLLGSGSAPTPGAAGSCGAVPSARHSASPPPPGCSPRFLIESRSTSKDWTVRLSSVSSQQPLCQWSLRCDALLNLLGPVLI